MSNITSLLMSRNFLLLTLLSMISLCIGFLAVFPGTFRLLISASIIIGMFVLSLRKPEMTLIFVLLMLPFIGFIRRALIPIAGWNTYDPIIIITPIIIIIIGTQWFLKRFVLKIKPKIVDTKLFHLVLLLLILSIIQIFNPLQGSILVGFGGVIYYIVPLLWMLVSREHFESKHIQLFFCLIYGVGFVSAIYGIIQTHIGFAPFETEWVNIAGYAALQVGDTIRAFSFFTSSQEFFLFLSVSIVIGWSYLMKGRLSLIKVLIFLTLPVLSYALFMTGSRTPMILTALSITIITFVGFRSIWARFLIICCAVLTINFGLETLNVLSSSENPLIAHQANGLTNPLDEEHSTLLLHLSQFIEGILRGIQVPIGHGLGSSTLAGHKLGNGGHNSEYDISDIMISHGFVGGLLYLLIMMRILRLLYSISKDGVLNLAIVGILLATIGFWLIGEVASVNAIIWVCIGYLDKMTKGHRLNIPRQFEGHMNQSNDFLRKEVRQ